MKFCLSLIFLLVFFQSKADWINLNTNINDNLTGIVVWDTLGAVSGHQGIYYSYHADTPSALWTRFNITGNTQDSIIYNNTRFNHCTSGSTNIMFACGTDTVNNQAVIFEIDLSTLTHSIIYMGQNNSALNYIYWRGSGLSGTYHSVGDSGLVVLYSGSQPYVPNTGLSNYNLTSISKNGNKYWLGADGAIIKGFGSITPTSSVITPTSHNFKDVYYAEAYASYGVGDGYYFSTGYNSTELNYYDYGPLNANCIHEIGSDFLIGTDHGIFISPGRPGHYVEWQPTSMNYSINEFWSESSGQVYACGENGVILTSANNGGTPIPYLEISSTGTCVNTNLQVNSIHGSSTSCAWYVNDTLQSTNCEDFAHYFSETGVHEIKLVAGNTVATDSVTALVNIVDVPNTNLNYSIADTILCHSEPIDITIDSTEQNVLYTLHRYSNQLEYSSSFSGNGGVLHLYTDSLSHPGPYYLSASSSLAACHDDFSDSINLLIERTTAKIHVGAVNAGLNENIPFYSNSTEADNFAWEFSPNANENTSSLENPWNNYGSIGNTPVKLVCWSDHGCYDSVEVDGPGLFDPNIATENCWTNLNTTDGLGGSGLNVGIIAEVSKSHKGFLVAGAYMNDTLQSQFGKNLVLPNQGGYMAQYNEDGTIKWHIKTNVNHQGGLTQLVNSVVEDSSKNIYLCGALSYYGSFQDNTGKEFNIENESFLIKMDSLGRLVWKRTFDNVHHFKPHNISLDYSQNVILSVSTGIIGHETQSYLNDAQLDTVFKDVSYYVDRLLIKFDSSGQILWESGLDGGWISEIQSDSSNNLYLTGSYQYYAHFHSVNDIDTINPEGISGLGSKLFHAKIDSNGEFVWVANSRTLNMPNATTIPTGTVTDPAGNSYIVGYNDVYWGASYQTFESTDGSSLNNSFGKYFIAKVNSNGKWLWVNGADKTQFGNQSRIAINSNYDEIVTTGNLRNIVMDTLSVTMTSQSGNNVDLHLNPYSIFVAKYDTAGILDKVCLNGDNQSASISPSPVQNILYNNDSSYYLSANIQPYLNPAPYPNFGDTLDISSRTKDFVSGFDLSCATCYCANSFESITYDTICRNESYTFPDGYYQTNITENMSHSSVFWTNDGCDSTINTYLTILPDSSENYVTICYGDSVSFADGSTEYNTFNNFTQTSVISSTNGCDSTVVTMVEVYSLSATITQNNNYLSTTIPGSYQWINCEDNSVIPGATNQSFTPTENGQYAVIINSNNCVDTSECIYFNQSGIDEYSNMDKIVVHPNPTDYLLNINTPEELGSYSIEIVDITGKNLSTTQRSTHEKNPIQFDFAPGIYYLRFHFETGYKETITVVKKE